MPMLEVKAPDPGDLQDATVVETVVKPGGAPKRKTVASASRASIYFESPFGHARRTLL